MSFPSSASSVRSLYRSLLREANKLPYGYLRAFIRFKYRDDVDAAARARKSSSVKLKRLSREIRKIRAANDGDKNALTRLLNVAYGRTGKLRWELLEPFLNSSTTELPPPIIPGVEKSRPPIYTKELTALLTSSLSRNSKRGLKIHEIESPPNIAGPRLDPSSEEARLLGPISKRRQVNARWRFFTKESRRVHLPLQVSLTHVDRTTGAVTTVSGSERVQKMQELGLIGGGFQNSGLLESLESMTGDHYETPRPRRERKDPGAELQSDAQTATPVLPSTLLRRSHRNLLGSLPLLTYYQRTPTTEGNLQNSGGYKVNIPRQAVSRTWDTIAPLPLIDETSMAWVRRAQQIDKQQESKSKDNKLD